jgi:hypothetical protein
MGRLRKYWTQAGASPEDLEQIDARYNYDENRITLYRLLDPTDELSVAETLAHEYLHALLNQWGEFRAARQLDLVSTPARNPERTGGI